MEDIRRVAGVLRRAQFVNSLGDGAFYVTGAVFFTTAAGLTPAQVGAALSGGWLLGFLTAAPIGAAGDRLGPRRTAVVLAVATAASLGSLAVVRSFGSFLVTVACYAVAQSGLAAVRQAMLVHLVPDGRRVAVRASLQVALNTGLGLGAAVGGLALAFGTRTAFTAVFVGDAAAFLVAAALLLRLPPVDHRPDTAAEAPAGVPVGGRLLAATALNAVLYLYMPVLSVLLPLWIARRTAAPLWIVGALFVLNTAGVAAAQRAAARRVVDLTSAAGSVRRGSLLLAAGCLLLAAAATPAGVAPAAVVLVLAGAVLTAGEVMLAAGSWEVGFALSDPRHPGRSQGLYSSGVPAARAVGPTALVALVLTWTGPGWLVLAGVFAASGAALASLARRSAARPMQPPIATGGAP